MARYDPFKEMDRMLEQFHTRVLIPEGSLSGGLGMPTRRDEGVNMDLTKRGDEFVSAADLPDFEREDIDLTFADGELTLVAETETSDEWTWARTPRVRARSPDPRATKPRSGARSRVRAAWTSARRFPRKPSRTRF
jgi:HSP20 family protein